MHFFLVDSFSNLFGTSFDFDLMKSLITNLEKLPFDSSPDLLFMYSQMSYWNGNSPKFTFIESPLIIIPIEGNISLMLKVNCLWETNSPFLVINTCFFFLKKCINYF